MSGDKQHLEQDRKWWGTSMAPTGKPPALDFAGGHDLSVMGSQAQLRGPSSVGCLLEILPLPLPLLLCVVCMCRCKSLSNNSLKKKNRK